jgi:hypothetical protein
VDRLRALGWLVLLVVVLGVALAVLGWLAWTAALTEVP